MNRFIVGAALALSLAACASTSPGILTDVHTGITAATSKRYQAAGGLLSSLNGTVVSAKGRHGVATEYLATGLGWAFFDQAWSFGQRLEFNVVSRNTLTCTSAGCSIEERGMIVLTDAQFDAATRNGLEFKLIGRSAEIVGKMPAEAFQQVKALAQ